MEIELSKLKENKSTKDITALNLINSYAKKIGVSVLTFSSNSQESGDSEEIKKGKKEKKESIEEMFEIKFEIC